MKRVRHWRGRQDLAYRPQSGVRRNRRSQKTGIILRRSEDGKIHFTCQFNGRFSRYVLTKKGEAWLKEQGLPVGSRIDREMVRDLTDFGYVRLDPSLAPAKERQRVTESTKARSSGWNWAEYAGYEERFGKPPEGSEAQPPAPAPGSQQPIAEVPGSSRELAAVPQSSTKADAPKFQHKPTGVPAKLTRRAKKRARRTKR